MKRRLIRRAISCSFLCVLVTGVPFVGCSAGKKSHPSRDSAPNVRLDTARIIDAEPKVEPKSRYGNPKSYVVMGRQYHVMKHARGYQEDGIASWYGTKFHGRRTSSGEPYDMYAMTAAHKSLPLPTYVEVTHLGNGKTIVVKVNDRGPFHQNRIIDLSYAAATKLGIIAKGTGVVRVTAIDPRRYAASRGTRRHPAPTVVADNNPARRAPVKALNLRTSANKSGPTTVSTPTHQARGRAAEHTTPSPPFFIQFGAFENTSNAIRLARRLRALKTVSPAIHSARVNDKILHLVRVGPLTSIAQADQIITRSIQLGFHEHHIVVE